MRSSVAVTLGLMLFLRLIAPPEISGAASEVRVWTTSLELKTKLTEGAPIHFEPALPKAELTLRINAARRYQTMLGLGASLEHSTCSNLWRLDVPARERTLRRLLDPVDGIGMNLMRICIGTSDFAGEDWYSYDDLSAGQTDPELKRFSIARDRAYVLPAIQLAHRINSNTLFFASPWSPPGWMKTTGTMIGGELLPRWYATYADYFVRFIQAYQAEGIPIYAMTVQNEPGVDRAKATDPKWHYPSCHWSAEAERDFIRDHLGPALRRAGLATRIWCYDHNYNLESKGESPGLAHPRTILSDPRAAAMVAGVAFHHYDGQPSGMSRFHDEFPGKPIHFSEGSVFSIYAPHDLMERLRHWACSYNAWVVMLDERGRPNRGPFPATRAILRLHSDTDEVEELFEYYAYGHFMKFIGRGAVRIESTPGDHHFNNVAFENPDGSIVLVVVNTTEEAKRFTVQWKETAFSGRLGATTVATYVWKGAAP